MLVDAQAVLGAAAKGRTSAGSISLDMKRIAVVTYSSDILLSYVYIPSEDNPADAPSRNVKTTQFGKRGARPVIGKLPVKNKYAKHKVSHQECGLPWWASSDNLVNNFLTNCCPDDKKRIFQKRLFTLWNAADVFLFPCVSFALDNGRALPIESLSPIRTLCLHKLRWRHKCLSDGDGTNATKSMTRINAPPFV